MDIRLAFFLGLLFIVSVASDDLATPCPDRPRTASGGTLKEMIDQVTPCKKDHHQQVHHNDDSEESKPDEVEYPSDDERYQPKRSQQIALSVLDLSQRLTEKILTQKTNGKYEIVSPISIASAIQLALLGAHGATFNELMDLLRYTSKDFSQKPSQIHEEFGLLIEDLISNSPSPKRFRQRVPWRINAPKDYERRAMKFQVKQANYDEHKISVANGIFVQRDFTIRREYKEVVENVYRGEIESLDFRDAPQESAKFINDWVNENTHGKIKEIIPGSTNPETRVILANALYFKAEWQETFIDGATGWKNFYPNGRDDNKTVVSVELMAHGGKFPHYYDAESDTEILGIPYKQNATTMYVILPKNSNPEKLKQTQKILTAEKIEDMISKMSIKTAIMLFPKMHLTSGHYLKPYLEELNVKTIFDPRKSDLSVLSEGQHEPPALHQSASAPISSNRIPLAPSKNNDLSFDRTEQLIFGRAGVDDEEKAKVKRDVSYKTESDYKRKDNPLTMKDFMLRKRMVKKSQEKKLRRSKRQFMPYSAERLDVLREMPDLANPFLFADEIIHKVDLTVNEKGTEGGAATAITLNRSGTSVVFRVDMPFMFLIRHDPTRVALFYGVVFQPEN